MGFQKLDIKPGSDLLYELEFNQRKNKPLNFFWTGIVIYIIAFVLAVAMPVNNSIYRQVELFGILLFIPAGLFVISFKNVRNLFLKLIFVLYIGWLLSIVVKGLEFRAEYISYMFLTASGTSVFCYLVPLILFLPQELYGYKKLFRVLSFLCFVYLLLDLLFIKSLLSSDSDDVTSQNIIEVLVQNLGLPAGFLLLTYRYHSGKTKFLALGAIVLSLFFAIIRARRGLILMSATTMLFSYVLYLFTSHKKTSLIFFSIIIGFFGTVYAVKIFNKEKRGMFALIVERGTEDTRSKVEDCFYDDMDKKDWIMGRGLNGQYFCPDIDENDVTGFRDIIETGYLQIILNGGIISLGLLLLIGIPAMIKGFFYSKNILSKAASIWILMWLIELYPASIIGLTLNYLLFWISIGICYSPKIRNIPETQMIELLQVKEGPKIS